VARIERDARGARRRLRCLGPALEAVSREAGAPASRHGHGYIRAPGSGAPGARGSRAGDLQDLDQLLSTLDVGIVFLDTDLNIRRFNKRAAAYISVLPQDIGRPLTHLTHTLDYAELLNDCNRVIKTGESHTCTVRWLTGRVKVRVHAFSGQANQPTGLVITLADESS